MGIGIMLGGCQGGDDRSAGTASPTPTATAAGTAWWKEEGATASHGATTSLAGAPLAGWQALPPVVPALAAQGSTLFTTKGCVSCHSIGKGRIVGPDLLGVTHRAEPSWLEAFITDPPGMLERDARAKELLAIYLVKMPKVALSQPEIRALLEYFRAQDETAARGATTPTGK